MIKNVGCFRADVVVCLCTTVCLLSLDCLILRPRSLIERGVLCVMGWNSSRFAWRCGIDVSQRSLLSRLSSYGFNRPATGGEALVQLIVEWELSFSSPEPLVPLSRLDLVHEEQLALGTHDLIGQNQTKGIQSDDLFQTPFGRILKQFYPIK